jgi:hypothetical protein
MRADVGTGIEVIVQINADGGMNCIIFIISSIVVKAGRVRVWGGRFQVIHDVDGRG